MRVRTQRLLVARLLGLWLAASTAPALGQVPEKHELSVPDPRPPASFVFGNLECPDPKMVQQAVLNLIPPERHALLEQGVRVELEDLADSYQVTVWKDGASVKKSYSDPARDCEGRARFAAVFTVLTLMPPELGVEPELAPQPTAPPPPVPKPVPAPRPTPTPTPKALPLVHLEVSALYAAAPAILEAPSMHSWGGELRVALGRGPFAGTVSAGYTSRARFELDGVQGELTRIPFSAGARLRGDFAAWSLTADLGLLLLVERVRATNLFSDHSQSSVNVGLRAGVQLARQFGPHFAPFLGTFAWFSPAPSEISALPQGEIGNLPYLWFGGAAGVSFGL